MSTSYTQADGYAGVSYNGYEANYGSVAEDDVRLRMHQDHVAVASEVRNLQGRFSQLDFDFGYTDYEHRKSTTAKPAPPSAITALGASRGTSQEARAARRRARRCRSARTAFSALGDEALVPTSQTTNVALFGLEEWAVGDPLKLSAGARYEYVKLEPCWRQREVRGRARARLQCRRFLSLCRLDPAWSIVGNVAYGTRADVLRTLFERATTRPASTSSATPTRRRRRPSRPICRCALRSRPNKDSVGVFYSRFSNSNT